MPPATDVVIDSGKESLWTLGGQGRARFQRYIT
jgi:hypothetical protein